jgi:hypothetical protein
VNTLAVRRPRTGTARMAAVAGFACLALATGCSGGATTPAGPAPAATAPAAAADAPGASAPTDFCSGMRDLAAKTNAMTQGGAISPAQYTATGDAMAALVPLAPPAATGPLKTLADEYHRIGAGTSTIEKSGPKLGKATIELAQSAQKCVGG